MRVVRGVALLFVLFVVTFVGARGQSAAAAGAGPAWADPVSWRTVRPTEADYIVYENVPLVPNPSADPNPGSPGGSRPPIPNTGPPGTMDLHVDVFQMPSAKPNPVVIQLHGGEWVRGDRPSNDQAFRGLLAAGMSVVTAEFRNAKDAPAPAAVEDVRCAMAWVKKNAAKYNFDTNRVVMYGLSSGAQLALMGALAPAAMTPAACADQPHVAAVLDWYGPVDLVEALKQKGTSDYVHQWLGLEEKGSADGVAANARWPTPADAAVLMKAKAMSPVTYIKAGGPPTFIVHGETDYVVDGAQSAELKKALDGAGVANGQYVVPGGGHGDFPRAEEDKAMLLCLKFLAANGVIP